MTKRGHEDDSDNEVTTNHEEAAAAADQEQEPEEQKSLLLGNPSSIIDEKSVVVVAQEAESCLMIHQMHEQADDDKQTKDKVLDSTTHSDHQNKTADQQDNNNNNHHLPKKIKLETSASPSSSAGEAHNHSVMNTSSAITSDPLHQEPHQHNAASGSGAASPSRVVHVRNIPSDATDTDLINLALPFGKITNLLLLRGKNQAMIEFGDISSAQCMVSYWQNTGGAPPTVRGRSVYCQFSNHQQIRASSSADHSNNNNGSSMNGGGGILNGGSTAHVLLNGDSGSSSSSVLRVVVEQPLYTVTLDNYHQLFGRCGKVAKIVTFHKNGSMQALIQFESVASATIARNSLDGTSMFGNSHNILRVGFSKLTNLNVKYNNDKSRDYSINAPPSSSSSTSAATAAAATASDHLQMHHQLLGAAVDPVTLAAYTAAMGGYGTTAASAAAATSGHHHASVMHHHHHHQQQLQQQQQQQQSYNGTGSRQSVAGLSRADHQMSHHHQQQQQMLANAHHPAHAAVTSGGYGVSPLLTGGSVLLVSSIPEQIATPEALFTLFGVYGDVVRVKVLFAKQDNALIQMAEAAQAALALAHLDKLRFLGKTLHVTLSKHSSVQLPKDQAQTGGPGADSGLTRDFSSCSQLHRFKKPGSKNYCNIFPPSLTLHLSNIPASCTEQDLREMFSRVVPASSVTGFKFFPRDRKMALVSLSSLDDSILALIKLHNTQLAESSHLRVSFSKSSI